MRSPHTAPRFGRPLGRVVAGLTVGLAPLVFPGCGDAGEEDVESAWDGRAGSSGAQDASVAGLELDGAASQGGSAGAALGAAGVPVARGGSGGSRVGASGGDAGAGNIASGGDGISPAAAGSAGVAGDPNTGAAGSPAGGGAGGSAGSGALRLDPVRILQARFNDDPSGFDIAGPDPVFVDSGVGGCERAISLLTPDLQQDPRSYQLSAVLAQSFKTGDVLYLQFWARSPDDALVGIAWDYNAFPWAPYYTNVVPTTPGWSLYRIPIVLRYDIEAGTSALRIRYGHRVGVVELACLTLDNYGPNADLGSLLEAIP